MTDFVGQDLGQYHVIEEIAKGGMSTIYRAEQRSVGRDVAIKLLPSSLTHDPTFLQRFYREVEIIARLQHPHILPVYDFGEFEGNPYIVMAYLKGGTLTDMILKGPMDLIEVGRIVREIADALDYAHSKGIIHRDFKPSNVLLDESCNTYLADFGLAKVSETSAQITGTTILGTPSYMAPEQADPSPLTSAADVYALGVTIFQMLTGRVPYEAPTPLGVLMAHATKPVPDIREIRFDLPENTHTVIGKARAKAAADRYPSPGKLAAALADLLEATATELRDTRSEVSAALMMTNMLGHVIFVDGQCLKLLKRHHSEARTIIGKPLHTILGIVPEVVEHLIEDVSTDGSISDMPLEVTDSRGQMTPITLSATATYDDEGNFVGTDITLKPVMAASDTLVAIEFDTVEQHLDTTEKTFLQVYFAAQIEGLIDLMTQWGGKKLGAKLTQILNQTAQRNVWPVSINDGKVKVELKNTEADIYRALLAKGVDYAVSMIGERVVSKSIKAVDKKVDPRIVAFIKELGVHDLFADLV